LRRLYVTSGCKGGAGKSTVACLLAYTLSQEGFSVMLLDLGGGDSGLLCLGRAPTCENPTGGDSPLEDLQESPLSSSLYVTSAPSLFSDGVLPENLESLYAVKPDIVVIDTGSCTTCCPDALLDLYIFVALPNWLSWYAYHRWLKKVGAYVRRDNLLLLLNMYQSLLADWRRRYAAVVEHLAVLSYDPALTFTYTRNIAEAFLVLGRGTRKNLQDILNMLTTLLQGTRSQET